MSEPTIYDKLLEIQRDLKVEKGRYNPFGKFNHRNKEDILEAAKPLAHERGLVILMDDDVVTVDHDWVYVKTVATLKDTKSDAQVTCTSWSREPKEKKGADASQITGMAASYAGKRALGNLFAIDDTKDADSYDNTPKTTPKSTGLICRCASCGKAYSFESYEQLTAWLKAGAEQCCPAPAWGEA